MHQLSKIMNLEQYLQQRKAAIEQKESEIKARLLKEKPQFEECLKTIIPFEIWDELGLTLCLRRCEGLAGVYWRWEGNFTFSGVEITLNKSSKEDVMLLIIPGEEAIDLRTSDWWMEKSRNEFFDKLNELRSRNQSPENNKTTTTKLCSTCHWYKPSDSDESIGYCQFASLGENEPNEPLHPESLAIARSYDCTAWLMVRENFGCVQWRGRTSPSA
jgi:hypothetical protein